ncbi:hypothetical protein M413DRAFT_376890 [Hebeloma cylindrosporum]|uniref:Uncharacterized protein n=1 Tax=Hebeloma cylindrosporum TaxID=76867 RepID=A0A0C3CJF2_HEBCY|nr:hypothetical protein M413DRAFT_376890 [Hebeloma cylindrosporum h7]
MLKGSGDDLNCVVCYFMLFGTFCSFRSFLSRFVHWVDRRRVRAVFIVCNLCIGFLPCCVPCRR